jgi:hypothetical protein
MCDSYKEYTIIEEHLCFSKSLHDLNTKGKRILQEIEKRKYYERKKRYIGFTYEVYNILNTILKPRVLSNNIYSSMLYFLDELLFLQVKETKDFFIEDEHYPLTYVYFNHDAWMYTDVQDFSMDNGHTLTETEALLLNAYIEEYENFALNLEKYLVSLLEDMANVKKQDRRQDKKLYRKLFRLISRLKRRLLLIKSKCLCIISTSIKSNYLKH